MKGKDKPSRIAYNDPRMGLAEYIKRLSVFVERVNDIRSKLISLINRGGYFRFSFWAKYQRKSKKEE